MAVTIRKGDALSGVNMTPIIDIVFQLLIFFMVCSRFEDIDNELPVMLPTAGAAMPMTAEVPQKFVNIDQHGQFFVQGEKMGVKELDLRIGQWVADNPGQGRNKVVIRCDKRCAVEHPVTVMDLLNKHNIRDYVLTAAPAPSA